MSDPVRAMTEAARTGTGTALFVGDVSLDLTMVVDHVPGPDEKVHVRQSLEAPGGVVANAAVACARTGTAVKALLQTGNDSAGSTVAAELRARGIQVQLDNVPGHTCRVVVMIDPHGEKRLLLDPGVSMYPSGRTVAQLDLAGTTFVHTAAYADAASILVGKCRSAGIRWSLDLEPATFPDGIDALAAMIDGAAVIFCNDRAAAAIGDDAAARLLAFGAKAIVRTRGAKGAQFISAETDFRVAAPSLELIRDTTGAGDCLAGWFIGETVAGRSPQAALEAAVIAAALSCRGLGAQDSFPTKADVAAFRASTTAAASNHE
jgi:ribokinase